MKFGNDDKAIIYKMDIAEAKEFVKFLFNKRNRHQKDIDDIYNLIISLGSKFHIPISYE